MKFYAHCINKAFYTATYLYYHALLIPACVSIYSYIFPMHLLNVITHFQPKHAGTEANCILLASKSWCKVL